MEKIKTDNITVQTLIMFNNEIDDNKSGSTIIVPIIRNANAIKVAFFVPNSIGRVDIPAFLSPIIS